MRTFSFCSLLSGCKVLYFEAISFYAYLLSDLLQEAAGYCNSILLVREKAIYYCMYKKCYGKENYYYEQFHQDPRVTVCKWKFPCCFFDYN